jgi:hypothetical protein
MKDEKNRYVQILEAIFNKYYQEGATEVAFERSDIIQAAKDLNITLPKNLGDVLYSFRYRTQLPGSILEKTHVGYEWIIRPTGRARYMLVMVSQALISPSLLLVETKIPDATPGIINKYALNDEQALLAKLRYSRMIDIFTGLTCYSLQSHLRTTAPGIGQAEIDEIYLGIDKRGVHYVLPLQAKGGKDKIGIVQIEQDFAICTAKFPQLICRSIAAQFISGELIALFEFEQTDKGIRVAAEKHYRLVRPENLSSEELRDYQKRPF